MKDDYWRQIEETAKAADGDATVRIQDGFIFYEDHLKCPHCHGAVPFSLKIQDPRPVIDAMQKWMNEARVTIVMLAISSMILAAYLLVITIR